ncbi:MAG: hypothetical protein H6Q89_4335 [Myxococcaceae bacterium]|nr:hypothetical protein [Myxococcaceae bacterium]
MRMREYETLFCRFLAILHFAIALGAFVGGGALVLGPDPGAPLPHLLAGFLLYGGVGLSNLIAGYFAARLEAGLEILSVIAGLSLEVWLCAEIVLLRTLHWLQPAYLGLSVFLVLSSIWIWRARHPRPFELGRAVHH